MDEKGLNTFVLSEMPSFIAVNYQRLLKAQTPQERVELALHIYNLGLRALTISLVSQYLIWDRERTRDPYLNELLLKKFPHLTLDAWQQLLFATLRAYEGNRDLFFMPELYDFYWDTSILPHRRRAEVEQPFERLTQLAVEKQANRLSPSSETAWEQLAAETMSLLQQILHRLAFIGQYDLIRVVDFDDDFYDLEVHKSLKIIKRRDPRPKDVRLTPGWFYLRRQTMELFLLHPLLVFWQEKPTGNEVALSDIGVYDRVIYERLQYLLTTLGKTVLDEHSVHTFITLLYETIEEFKHKRQKTERLTWWQLRDLCDEISQRRMGTVRHKYRQELYLQRDKTYQAFENFLESDKRCFVLIGKSGVGKSNFLVALGETLQQSHSDLCLLMYDGAHLQVEPSITEMISQDFDNRLVLADRRVQHIWREIAQVEGIEQRRVILCVDALNENPQAKNLLRQLDELVQSSWPWLKVLFSSRPETWRSIKRGVRLAEWLYYREEGATTLGVELEQFSYSEQMEAFSRQELPTAYNKYRQVFNLQTPYKALPPELREMLRDPLNLWLIANTYEGQPLPNRLKVTELIEQYIQALLQSERLHKTDLRLLERQLVPLLVNEQDCRNAITIADIDAVGGGLYETIYSDQLLSDGQRLNQSFINLLDTDILVRQAERREEKITFKYERFYEHFVGKRIFELSKARTNPVTFFREWVSKIQAAPFLWGAIKNALLQEAKKRGPETLIQLCFTDQQRVKEMMVSVLTDLGRDQRTGAKEILERLLPATEKVSKLQSLRRLLGQAMPAPEVRSRHAKKIAIEVASNLNVPQVLHTAALQTDPTIRTTAVRYTYHLWQHDQEAGFNVLEQLAQSVISGLIPNFSAFESVLGLSLVIFFDHPRDEIILKRLQNIWRGIIAKIFGIQESNSRWGKLSREFIRERIFSFLITVIFQVFHEFPRYNPVNYQDLEKFFQLGASEKALYKNLTQYLDIQGPYTREQMEQDFMSVLKIRNMLVGAVAFLGLMVHTYQSPPAFLPFLKNFFQEALQDPIPGPYLSDVPFFLCSSVLDRFPMPDEMFDFFVYTVEVCQEYYTEHPDIPGLNRTDFYGAQAVHLASYILAQYQRAEDVRTGWLETRIYAALSQKDIPFFDRLFEMELPLVGIEMRHPQVALDVLSLFFNQDNPEIDQKSLPFLSRLRVHYPDEVDEFLEEQQASDMFRLQVQTNEPSETIGELIGQRSTYFLRDDIIMGPLMLRSQLIRMFAKAADCKNAREWLDYLLREIINLIYGDQVLRQA